MKIVEIKVNAKNKSMAYCGPYNLISREKDENYNEVMRVVGTLKSIAINWAGDIEIYITQPHYCRTATITVDGGFVYAKEVKDEKV